MLLGGCASYGEVVNEPLEPGDTQHEYSLKGAQERKRLSGEKDAIDLTLAFSGGGTRAAAMAYGVLLALRETTIQTTRAGSQPS